MKKRLLQSALVVATVAGLAWPAAAARLEYEVKAAFLYNFAKFVEWPVGAFPDADAPLELCVLGDDPFGEVLDRTVRTRTVRGRSINVQHGVEGDAVAGCHMLFVGQAGEQGLAHIVHRGGDASVLTVGESEAFVDEGGMIRLFVEGGKVRFEVNAGAAERAQLKLSSQLLKLARSVRR